VFIQPKVDELLVEAAVVHFCREFQRAFGAGGDFKLIAHNLRATRRNGVVEGDDTRVPDLVVVVQHSVRTEEAIGKAVRAGIELTITPQGPGMKKNMAV